MHGGRQGRSHSPYLENLIEDVVRQQSRCLGNGDVGLDSLDPIMLVDCGIDAASTIRLSLNLCATTVSSRYTLVDSRGARSCAVDIGRYSMTC